jgi:hypothetical protein
MTRKKLVQQLVNEVTDSMPMYNLYAYAECDELKAAVQGLVHAAAVDNGLDETMLYNEVMAAMAPAIIQALKQYNPGALATVVWGALQALSECTPDGMYMGVDDDGQYQFWYFTPEP